MLQSRAGGAIRTLLRTFHPIFCLVPGEVHKPLMQSVEPELTPFFYQVHIVVYGSPPEIQLGTSGKQLQTFVIPCLEPAVGLIKAEGKIAALDLESIASVSAAEGPAGYDHNLRRFCCRQAELGPGQL